MKNVALIIPSLKGGGAERVISILSQELSKDYNLYLIVFDADDIAYSYGGNLIDLNIKANKNFFIKIFNVIRRVYYLRKVKLNYNIECSISFLSSANIVNVLSRTNDKIVLSVRSYLSKRKKTFYNRIYKLIIKILYNKADNVIAISKGVAKDLINNYKLDSQIIQYIYNPIKIEEIYRLAKEEIIEERDLFKQDDFILINVGRLTKAKGQWHLIRALTYVKKEIKNFKLLILGEGELENYLKDLVKNLGLNENVFFLGYKKNPFKYMSKSDLFVFSSLYEGFGNVLIEAMACGVPVISTDCRSGPREILAPGTDVDNETFEIKYCEYGVLIPVCDGIQYDHNKPLTKEEKLLAKSIIKLIKNEKLRKYYSIKGKYRAEDFNVDIIAKQWENLFH